MEWCTQMIRSFILCLSLRPRLKPLHQLNLVWLTLDLGQHQINSRLTTTRLRLCTSDPVSIRTVIFLVSMSGTLWSNRLIVSKILVYTLTSTLRCLIILTMCVAWPSFLYGLLVNYAKYLGSFQRQSALFTGSSHHVWPRATASFMVSLKLTLLNYNACTNLRHAWLLVPKRSDHNYTDLE